MLKEFNFALGDTDNNLEFVENARMQHQSQLEKIQKIKHTKQQLEKDFTLQQLDAFTEQMNTFSQVKVEKIISSQYIQFLECLSVPFQPLKNQLKDKILDILQMSVIETYQMEIVHSIIQRLISFKQELDDRDEQSMRMIENLKDITLLVSEEAPASVDEKLKGTMTAIVLRDAVLSHAFEAVDAPYESTLLGRIFKKLYEGTKSIMVEGGENTQGEIDVALFQLKELFVKNSRHFKNMIQRPKDAINYYIKELYRCLVARRVVEILGSQQAPFENVHVLVSRLLKLEADIKAEIPTEDAISDKESLLNVIFQQNRPVFEQILKHEQSIFREKILKFSVLGGSNTIKDIKPAVDVFKAFLQEYYAKYSKSSAEFKPYVDNIYSDIISRMLNELKERLLSIIDNTKPNGDQQDADRFGVLECAKSVEIDFEKDEIMREIRSHRKGVDRELESFQVEFNAKFMWLVDEDYDRERKRINSESSWINDLLKQKSTSFIQKEMFLRRMRLLFFKFLKNETFTKEYLQKFLDIFAQVLKELFKSKAKEINEVLLSGNHKEKAKELTFLDEAQRNSIEAAQINK